VSPAAKEDSTKSTEPEPWTGGEGDEEIVAARKAAKFYCPACGKPSDLEIDCTGGTGDFSHEPVPVVSTKELDGDPEDHTAAPGTDA